MSLSVLRGISLFYSTIYLSPMRYARVAVTTAHGTALGGWAGVAAARYRYTALLYSSPTPTAQLLRPNPDALNL